MFQLWGRMANHINYFEQVIFPPLTKEEKEPHIGRLNLSYWFEYDSIGTKMMVKCPECNKVYRYSRLQKDTCQGDIVLGVRENMIFFKTEWTINCPDYSIHDEKRVRLLV